jgi:hypothetical protein
VKRLTITILVYGAIVTVAYLAGWVAPRVYEGASALPCWIVAAWYARTAWHGEAILLCRWGWGVLAFGWLLVGGAFLLPPGTARGLTLASAGTALTIGFLTVWLAHWNPPGTEGGEAP